MQNLIDEQLVPFATGVRSLPGRPSISTGYRYALHGIRGVRLQTIVSGGRRYTSREALRRFVVATTAAADRGRVQIVCSEKPMAADDNLEQRLNKAGL